MNITLRQLQVFCAIATERHVTRAAEGLAMTQSAASMALSDLENQLGVRLFDRQGKQLTLTDAGRMLLDRSREVLERVRDIEDLAKAQGARFDLRLGASVTIGNHLLPPLITRLRQSYPEARVQFARYNSEQIVQRLLAFEIDLGFVEGPMVHPQVKILSWQKDRLIVFAAPNHPLAGHPLKVADFDEVEWIVRERGSGTRHVLDEACERARMRIRIALELEQPEAIRQCVREGLGVGCLSELELAEAFRAGWLVPLQTDFLDMQRELSVVVHRNKYVTHGMAGFLELCGISPSDQ